MQLDEQPVVDRAERPPGTRARRSKVVVPSTATSRTPRKRTLRAGREQDVPHAPGRDAGNEEPRLAERARVAEIGRERGGLAEPERDQPPAGEDEEVGRVAAAELRHDVGGRGAGGRVEDASACRARGRRDRACPTASGAGSGGELGLRAAAGEREGGEDEARRMPVLRGSAAGRGRRVAAAARSDVRPPRAVSARGVASAPYAYAGAPLLAAMPAISSETRSNSSSDSTGVPSNGRSRVISSHERHPP